MSLQYLHLVRGPVIQHATVGGGVEGDRTAMNVEVEYTRPVVIAVDPTHVLQCRNTKSNLTTNTVTLTLKYTHRSNHMRYNSANI